MLVMVVGVYFDASAVGSKGGDGGSGINGNILIDKNIENEIISKMKERLKK